MSSQLFSKAYWSGEYHMMLKKGTKVVFLYPNYGIVKGVLMDNGISQNGWTYYNVKTRRKGIEECIVRCNANSSVSGIDLSTGRIYLSTQNWKED